MKILIVSQYFHPEPSPVNDLACWLTKHGNTVDVLTGQPNYPSGRPYPGYTWFHWTRERWREIGIRRVPTVPRGAGGGVALGFNYLSFAISAMLAALFASRRRYDVVLCVTPSPLTAALPGVVVRYLRRVPLAVWVQDLWPESIRSVGAANSRLLLFLIGRVVRFIYRSADRIFISSRGFRSHVERRGIPPSAIAYLPNTAEDVYRNGASSLAARPSEGFRIVYAGNLGQAQGLETLLEAASLIPPELDIRWIVIGDGRCRAWFLEEVERRDLQAVTVLEPMTPDTLVGLLNAADASLVLLRDDRFLELAVPSKISSCLAIGKPILAALAGEGAKIIRESGGGVICRPGDAAALARAAIALSETPPEDRRQLGNAGRSYYDAHLARDLVYDTMLRQVASLSIRPDSRPDMPSRRSPRCP